MTEQFHQPPEIPKASNIHGEPSPPSGLHPAVSPVAVVTMVGALPASVWVPSEEPAPNIHE